MDTVIEDRYIFYKQQGIVGRIAEVLGHSDL